MLLAMAATIGAQGPPAVFEAASIKLNVGGGFVSGLRRAPGGRFEVTNMTLAGLIGFAHGLQPFELQGGPAWLASDRWDVIAKVDGDPPPAAPGTPDTMQLATRALLAERFKLRLHRETSEVDVYELVMARSNGKPAAGLRPSTADCLAIRRAADDAARGGPAAPAPNTPERVVCGIRNNGRRIQFGGYPMAMLTDLLTTAVQRRVVDSTGLTGNWEFDLSFAPPQLGTAADAVDPNGPSLFTALQEQLGLRLQPARRL